jgi:hypothetical protein
VLAPKAEVWRIDVITTHGKRLGFLRFFRLFVYLGAMEVYAGTLKADKRLAQSFGPGNQNICFK